MEIFVSCFYYVKGKYQLNDTTDWWPAYPWWYWDFDPKDSNVHILSQNDPIFVNCVEKDSMKDEIIFDGIEDISLKELKAQVHIDINSNIHPADSEMIDLTTYVCTSIVIDDKQGLVLIQHYCKCNDCEDKMHLITIGSSIIFSTYNIANHFAIKGNECQIDHKLITLIFDSAMSIIDRETWPTVQSTPYRGVKMAKNINNRRLKEQIKVCFGTIEHSQ